MHGRVVSSSIADISFILLWVGRFRESHLGEEMNGKWAFARARQRILSSFPLGSTVASSTRRTVYRVHFLLQEQNVLQSTVPNSSPAQESQKSNACDYYIKGVSSCKNNTPRLRSF